MDAKRVKVQWAQLLVLSGVHFLVDMFGNMLPAILPEVRREFALSLFLGSIVLASLTLSANGVQLVTGHLRAKQSTPLFLYLGLVLAASTCLLAMIPRSGEGVVLMVAIAVVSGSGIAVAHPEGLRAVHTLSLIPSELATAVFMTSGFLGFASGGAVSAWLVSEFGLPGLYPLVGCALVGIVAVGVSRVRLASEQDEEATQNDASAANDRLPFWPVLAMGVPAAVSTTVVLLLLPTHLNEMGFSLTFGGVSAAMFGWGGAVGPFLWAAFARKRGDLPCAMAAFFISFPLLIMYLVFVKSKLAVAALFGVGFCAMSAYILTITLARHCRGLNLGHRMAFVVGGTWGFSTLVFMGLSGTAEDHGTGVVFAAMPAGYLLSGLLALRLVRRYPQLSRRSATASVTEAAAQEHPPV
jgi:hypothetical protein